MLVDMPPLLREIVRGTLAHAPDLDVVGEHDGSADLRAAVEEDGADFLIVGSEATAEAAVHSLVGADLGVRALEVQSDGKESVLYELRPHRVPLGEISPETLLRTIRAVPSWDAEP